MLSQWKLFDNLRRSLVPAGVDAAAAARLDRASARLAVDAGGDRHPRCFRRRAPSSLDLLRKPDEVLLRQHLAATASAAGRHAAQTAADARLPAVRGDGQPRRDRAHRVADAGHAPTAARMESVGRRRTGSSRCDEPAGRSELAASFKSMWIAPVIAAATAIAVGASRAIGPGGRRADPAPVVRRRPESPGGSAGRSLGAKRG